MSVIAYLLDENVDPHLQETLRQGWPDVHVLRVGTDHAPSLGTPDPEILRWCETHRVSLVTNNRRSMPAHLREHLAADRHVPGIFILPSGSPLESDAERLALVWGASESEEYDDRIVYLTEIT